MSKTYDGGTTLTKSSMAQGGGVSNRQVDLASLVPEDSIDKSMRIPSLDGWLKTEQLGQGTFGEVWKYCIPIDGIPIAAGKILKVQLWNLSDKQKADLKIRVNSFVSELNMLHKVSSECSERFVQFIGCYLDSKKLILFTECMANGSIKDHIIEKPLDEPTALKYTFQAAEGLNFLHHYEKGRIVHRDIKCDNLLLTAENNVKLADFGLAYNLAVDNESYTMSQGAPCGVAGTVIFAAPEVLLDTTTYGRSADIWSLGCTLVEMLTCQPPHADFWHKHKERAQFLFLEQVRADPPHQLLYEGHSLVPRASTSVQRLLDCLFIRNKMHRPRSEDVLAVFVRDPISAAQVKIDEAKLDELREPRNRANSEKETSYGAGKTDKFGFIGSRKLDRPNAAGKRLKKLQLWNLSDKQKAELQKRVHAFVKELNTLHKVSSECSAHCVQFLGCYLDHKKIVVFTEYMPNGSIKDHLNDDPLQETVALKYTFQAVQGLHFLHHYPGGSMVHHDIKCDNLLLTSDYNVKLADFGLAYSLKVDNDSFTMSGPSGFAGTVIFAAPEVLVGDKYGRNADIWSLGCTLVEMLTRQPPHADFWHKHQERAQFLFVEQAQGDSEIQLQYIGNQLVTHASASVQKLLDCFFIRNKLHRPRSEDIVSVFTFDQSAPANVIIDPGKLEALHSQISKKEQTPVEVQH